MVQDWEVHRDVPKYSVDPEDFVASYLGLGALRLDIIKSEESSGGLAVVFTHQECSRCELEQFNADALSFLPIDRDKGLRRGMLDWESRKVGVFNFVRENEREREGPVVGCWWKWDEHVYVRLWAKVKEDMSDAQIARVIEKHGGFLKDALENDTSGRSPQEGLKEDLEGEALNHETQNAGDDVKKT